MNYLLYFALLIYSIIHGTIYSYSNLNSDTKILFSAHLDKISKNISIAHLAKNILPTSNLVLTPILKNKHKYLPIAVNTALLCPLLLDDSKKMYKNLENSIQDDILINNLNTNYNSIFPYYIFKIIASNVNYLKNYKTYKTKKRKYLQYLLPSLACDAANPFLTIYPIKFGNIKLFATIDTFLYTYASEDIFNNSLSIYLHFAERNILFNIGYENNLTKNTQKFFTKFKVINIVNYNNSWFLDGEFGYKHKYNFEVLPFVRFNAEIFEAAVGIQYIYNHAKVSNKHQFNFILNFILKYANDDIYDDSDYQNTNNYTNSYHHRNYNDNYNNTYSNRFKEEEKQEHELNKKMYNKNNIRFKKQYRASPKITFNPESKNHKTFKLKGKNRILYKKKKHTNNINNIDNDQPKVTIRTLNDMPIRL